MPPKPIQRDRLRQTIQTLEGLTPEDRSALLGLLAEKKRYGLVWEDKPEDAHELLREQIPVFKEDESRRIVARSRSLSDPPQGDCIEGPADDAPHHVLIEGDNLHALAALQYTHAGKVDVIYIDPPYNTGNKDFRYNDDYVDKEDAWRHSKWLSFMRNRLKLAKILINDSGVIYVSIDDNEVAALKLLLDEIMGDSNKVGSLIWYYEGVNDNEGVFKRTHEYVLVYAKNSKVIKENSDSRDLNIDLPEAIENSVVKNGAKNPPKMILLPKGFPAGDEAFEIEIGGSRAVQLMDKIEVKNWKLVNPVRVVSGWSSAAILQRFIACGFNSVLDSEGQNTTFILTKNGNIFYKKERSRSHLITVLRNYGTTMDAGKKINEMGVSGFQYPKPVGLIQFLLTNFGAKKSLILDFFAGSGTTLHATMALNAEDGGKRQCILVTNNENQICEEVTYERNKRVIQGYTTPKGDKVAGLTDNHLHYLKTEFVKREPSLKNRRQLMKLSVDLLRLKENAWDRLEALCVKNEVEAFQGNGFTLFVVLDTDAIPTVIEHIKAQEGKAKVYVFSPGAYAWDEEFEEVREQIDLCAVPEAIYRALEPHLPAVKRIDDEVAA